MALGRCSDQERRQAVLAMADALEAEASQIVAANAADLEAAAADGLAPALVARLKLDAQKLAGRSRGCARWPSCLTRSVFARCIGSWTPAWSWSG